jgi:8-oxo-dGTP pyrophosphatase MutT (NUDIX family)
MAQQRDTPEGHGARPPGEPVPAATVILVRDTEEGIETLMLRRNSRLEFAGGMWVFPGGRVDAADRTGLDPDERDAELAAARRAAVREAHEESGLVVAPASMIPFSHWTPPAIAPKRFVTWFFVATAPSGIVAIDRGEIHDHAWMQPAAALRDRDAGGIELTPPTWVTLHELSQWHSASEVCAGVRDRRPEWFVTRVALTDEGPIALWHGDAGYEDSDATKPGARHRLVLGKTGWRYERTVGRQEA